MRALFGTGGWASLADAAVEDRALSVPTLPQYPMVELAVSRTAPLDVSTSNALAVSDAYACVRLLADSISSLPLKAYRKTDSGRIPAGDGARISQLFARPSPGSTSVDLISQILVHLNLFGECFIGKYRSADGEIVQLGVIHPETVHVELRGQRIVYTLNTNAGFTEHGPDDVLHIKSISVDGLRGLSPVTQCRIALGLSSSLQQSAKTFTEQGSRPSGILSAAGPGNREQLERVSETWQARHGGVPNMHRIAVVSGDIKFEPVSFSADDAQFLQQRDLSAREVARIFRVPAWAIDAPTGDSLTYANVENQNRFLVAHSLRPWIVRVERAISSDTDLCPGGTYVEFDLDGLLRADAKTRADTYTLALGDGTHPGWMTRAEVRELENLAPEATT